jgi:hypothetical protein
MYRKINLSLKCLFAYRLEDELDRSSHHASANVDLHVYTQRLENDCRDLRCQITMRDKEKVGLNQIIADFEVQVSISNILFLCPKKTNLRRTKSVKI